MTTYVDLFAWKGQRINPLTADRIGRELDEKIRGHEDGKVVSMVELGTLALGCMATFGWSEAECRRRMCVNHNRMNHSVRLARKIGRDDGGLDEDKVGPLRHADGSLPTLTTILRHFGIIPPAKSSRTTPNKTSVYADEKKPDDRDSGTLAVVTSGQARTQWRHGPALDTEHGGVVARAPEQSSASRDSLSPPVSGLAGGDAGAHGHGPEPMAGRGRASTRARGQALGGHASTSPGGPAGGGEAGRPSPRSPAGLAGGLAVGDAHAAHGLSAERSKPRAGTVGGVQMTMDALYAGAISGAERLLADLAELLEKDGLNAAKVMAAQLCISDGLGYLREAGAWAQGPSRTTGAVSAG